MYYYLFIVICIYIFVNSFFVFYWFNSSACQMSNGIAGFGLAGRRDYMEDEHIVIEDVFAFYNTESANSQEPLIISSLYDSGNGFHEFSP
jgi:hypothetical protein